LREALATYRRILPPGSWQVGQVESVLGASVGAQGRWSEAESLLVNGYSLLDAHSATPPDRKEKAGARLVDFYRAWAKAAPAQAASSAAWPRWGAATAAADSARARTR